MNWTAFLKGNMEYAYSVTEKLVDRVTDDTLQWKPETGTNWMTVGQLLKHITGACGVCCKGFVTGDWGMPEGVDYSELPPEEMLPPAEALPTVESVAEAKQLLAEDKRVAFEMVDQAGEDALANLLATAPWDNMDMILGHRLLQMVAHLNMHKGQLFYYLKLQGQPVNTNDMWGG